MVPATLWSFFCFFPMKGKMLAFPCPGSLLSVAHAVCLSGLTGLVFWFFSCYYGSKSAKMSMSSPMSPKVVLAHPH